MAKPDRDKITAEYARQKFGVDIAKVGDALRAHDDLAGMLVLTTLGELQIVPYDCPIVMHAKSGLLLADAPVPEAFVLRARDKDDNMRWWICTTAPSGQLVRILTSYDGKAPAERAIKTLGYKLIATPKGQALADMTTL